MRNRPNYCRSCGKSTQEVGVISWRGNCETCGIGRHLENTTQLREQRGPFFRYWRRRTATYFESAVDTPRPEA